MLCFLSTESIQRTNHQLMQKAASEANMQKRFPLYSIANTSHKWEKFTRDTCSVTAYEMAMIQGTQQHTIMLITQTRAQTMIEHIKSQEDYAKLVHYKAFSI